MRAATPELLAVATAVPPHKIGQEDAKQFSRAMFQHEYENIERLLAVFDNSRIRTRYLAAPIDWILGPHNFSDRNDLYGEVALELAEEAARKALARAGVEAREIGHLVFVSTTGYKGFLESQLVDRLGLPSEIKRLPLNGFGCAGGVAGLRAGMVPASSQPGEAVLVVTVELTSLTFQPNDKSKANFVATSLFGDGAAAAVIRGSEPEKSLGVSLLDSFSWTWPDTPRMMGWDVIDPGLKIVIDRQIPVFVRKRMPEHLEKMRAAFGVELAEIMHYVIHPGGARVLDAFEGSFGLNFGGLGLSRQVLEEYGNMSSATVLFVLERFLQEGSYRAESGDLGVISALGPGFSVEHVLFRCGPSTRRFQAPVGAHEQPRLIAVASKLIEEDARKQEPAHLTPWASESFAGRNARYVERALELSTQVAEEALARAGASPRDVGAIFVVSSTGIATPSLDARLIFLAGLREDVQRYPIWGMGDQGGAAGVARAAAHARLHTDRLTLLVAVELPTLLLPNGVDENRGRFGDGAAAVVLGVDQEPGIRIISSHSAAPPGSTQLTLWDLALAGVGYAEPRPEVAPDVQGALLTEAAARLGLGTREPSHVILDSGPDSSTAASGPEPYRSSVAVLVKLEEFICREQFAPGELGLLSCLGPFGTAEHVLFTC